MKRKSTWWEIAVLVFVPIAMATCAFLRIQQTALLTVLIVIGALVVFFAGYERSKPSVRQIVPIAVLSALAAAGRILFAALPDVKPVSAICIVSGVVFGRRTGFMVGALAALVSNIFFGQGAWTPWQMYAWGLIGYLAGVLEDHHAFESSRPDGDSVARRSVLYFFGFFSALLYGFILNSFYVLGYVVPLTWQGALAGYGAGLALDLVHGTATVGFLLLIYAPWRRKLERIKRKFALA